MQIAVFLEPVRRELLLEVFPRNSVHDIIRTLVAHLREAPGFDVEAYLTHTIGEALAPTWQLVRNGEDRAILPPATTLGSLAPPLRELESFTLQVAAVIA